MPVFICISLRILKGIWLITVNQIFKKSLSPTPYCFLSHTHSIASLKLLSFQPPCSTFPNKSWRYWIWLFSVSPLLCFCYFPPLLWVYIFISPTPVLSLSSVSNLHHKSLSHKISLWQRWNSLLEGKGSKGKEEAEWTEITFSLSVKSGWETVKIHMLIILVTVKYDWGHIPEWLKILFQLTQKRVENGIPAPNRWKQEDVTLLSVCWMKTRSNFCPWICIMYMS